MIAGQTNPEAPKPPARKQTDQDITVFVYILYSALALGVLYGLVQFVKLLLIEF